MVRIVQPEASHEADVLARERGEQLRDRQLALRELRGRVEGALADDLKGFDGLAFRRCQTN